MGFHGLQKTGVFVVFVALVCGCVKGSEKGPGRPGHPLCLRSWPLPQVVEKGLLQGAPALPWKAHAGHLGFR